MNQTQPNSASATKPKHQTMPKTWIIAKRRSNHDVQQATNNTVEVLYTSILTKVKMLTRSSQPIFERDYMHDRTESGLAMHCLLTSTCYVFLECDAFYDYRVEYAFNNCPFEAVIRGVLQGYPFDVRSKEIKLEPDFNTFYKATLAFQDQKYITHSPIK